MFQDQVFCFTPKGDLIHLPANSNSIDFAYALHSEIGNRCVGCKINGKPRPLFTKLQNGDEIEILTSKKPSPPSLKFPLESNLSKSKTFNNLTLSRFCGHDDSSNGCK